MQQKGHVAALLLQHSTRPSSCGLWPQSRFTELARWCEDSAALREELGMQRIDTAQARDRARDLETKVAELLMELETASGGLLPRSVSAQTARGGGRVGLDASLSSPQEPLV